MTITVVTYLVLEIFVVWNVSDLEDPEVVCWKAEDLDIQYSTKSNSAATCLPALRHVERLSVLDVKSRISTG